jgi:hypothetical protein
MAKNIVNFYLEIISRCRRVSVRTAAELTGCTAAAAEFDALRACVDQQNNYFQNTGRIRFFSGFGGFPVTYMKTM